MEHIGPLAQTLLWVGLLGVVLWRFHNPLYHLLSALAKRVEGGSTLKAGPFELASIVKPQSPEEQRKVLAQESREPVPGIGTSVSTATDVQSANLRALTTAAQYLRAEDLALRALQSEVGQVLSRQVKIGSTLEADAVFTKDAHLTIVEVKFVAPGTDPIEQFRSTLERIHIAIENDFKLRSLWPTLLVVFVHPDGIDDSAARGELLAISRFSALNIKFKHYSFSELQRLYDAGTGAA